MVWSLRLQLLGTAHIESAKSLHPRLGQKGRALLFYLARLPHPIPRMTPVNLIWPNSSESGGRNNLNRELSYLRASMPADWLNSEGDTIQFTPGQGFWLDVDAFTSYMDQKRIQAYLSAMELYRGEFMQGFVLDGESIEFERWLHLERQHWHEKAIELLNRAAKYHHNQPEQVLGFAKRLLLLEPWREEVHRSIMLILARMKQKNAALVQFQRLLEALDELEEEPGAETIRLYNRIRQGAHKLYNIPPQQTTFVGRENEQAELFDKFAEPSCRLVTLVGMGGVGKTRLALHISELLARKAFLHGGCFVSIAATEKEYDAADKLTTAIANALRLFSISEQDVATYILNHLQDKEMLLVLDNIEPLLRGRGREVREFIAAILHRAPEMKLLITSRERLNLRAEHTFELSGLSYPPNQRGKGGDAQEYDSAQLFDVTAKRITSRFSPDRKEMQAVRDICTLVEGSPLAIELAASLVKGRSCAEILAAIRRTLDVLVVEMPDVPERQRSLRATFEYSWALLDKQEQHLLAKLSLFHKSFSYDAAQAIVMAEQSVLEELVNKSLLKRYEGRYEFHDLVWHYSKEKAALLQESTSVLDRHSSYYLRLWEQYGNTANQPALEQASFILDDLGNIHAAWQWAIQRKNLGSVEQALSGLETFYSREGQHQEGIVLLQSALKGIKEIEPDETLQAINVARLSVKLLIILARLLHLKSDYIGQIDAAQQAVALSQVHNLPQLEAEAHIEWAGGFIRQSDFESSRNQIEQALELARATDTPKVTADCLHHLGVIDWCIGDLQSALVHLEDALPLRSEAGDSRGTGFTHLVAGGILFQLGHISEALEKFEQAAIIFHKLRDLRFEGETQFRIGDLFLVIGESELAETALKKSLEIASSFGTLSGQIQPLLDLSFLHAYQGNNAKARASIEQALENLDRLDSPPHEGLVVLTQGVVFYNQNQLDQAADAYHRALALFRKLDMPRFVVDSLAGLAAVALKQSQKQAALSYVEEILAYGEDVVQLSFTGYSNIYLTCYHVLKANSDDRAIQCLKIAYQLLQEQASNITNAQHRHSFLENVMSNRTIFELTQNV